MKRIKIFFGSISLLLLLFLGYMRCNHLNVNDVGLQVLTWVKKIKGESVNLSSISSDSSVIVDHDLWTELLSKYVSETGSVDYKGFANDSIKFSKYLDLLTNNPPGKNLVKSDQLAYWINAYNAFTVKLIINHYPLHSIKDISDGLPMISSPWDMKFFKIGNTDFDLNTIEHEVLRRRFDEPRIHFAINCASISCPILRNEAYIGEKIENQLEDQAYQFINDPNRNIISNNITQLSRIFDWFKSDYLKKADLFTYIKKYNSKLNTENKVVYLEYDWGLND